MLALIKLGMNFEHATAFPEKEPLSIPELRTFLPSGLCSFPPPSTFFVPE